MFTSARLPEAPAARPFGGRENVDETIMNLGGWRGESPPSFDPRGLVEATHRMREPVHLVREGAAGRVGVAFGGQRIDGAGPYPLLASLPALYPEWLGDRSFLEVHGVRFPYVAGAMANGIATAELVIAMAQAQMLGFFGAGGLSFERVEVEIARIQGALNPGQAWGANLIHSPNEPELEAAVADLYIRAGVPRVSASAYMKLTAPIVRYSASGLYVGPDGEIARKHHVFAKVSRPEVASVFMAPAPAELLSELVLKGQLSAEQARLAERVPVAEDYTVEADSGGHTDNRPLPALMPIMLTLRDEPRRQVRVSPPDAYRSRRRHRQPGERRLSLRDGRGLRLDRLHQPIRGRGRPLGEREGYARPG